MSSQSKNQYPRVTTQQLKALAEIVALIQELSEVGNATQLAPKLGVSKQALQQHIDKAKEASK